MNIQFWPATQNTNIASYRIRCLNVIRGLNKLGETASLYEKGNSPDILILSKRYDEKSIKHALELKKKHRVKLYLDICDNHFYYNHPDPIAVNRARILKRAIEAVDCVIASTRYLSNIIFEETKGVTPILIVGDLIELPAQAQKSYSLKNLKHYFRYYRLKLKLNNLGGNKKRRLIWFGNHGSQFTDGGMNDLRDITSYLENMNKTTPISLTVVSNSQEKYEALAKDWKFQSYYIEWNNLLFSQVLLLHGISLIPINKNPFTLAKTNNRVTTSLMHGLEVFTDKIEDYLSFEKYINIEKWNYLVHLNETHETNRDFFNSEYCEKYNSNILTKWADISLLTYKASTANSQNKES